MQKLCDIVVACDSFKGSLTALQACKAVARGVTETLGPDCNVTLCPMADGGEGTAATLVDAFGGRMVSVPASDPLGNPVTGHYGVLPSGTAVVELAEVSGLTCLNASERNPLHTSTFGTGSVIRQAIEAGCRRIVLCIGGSATNDAAMGLLSQLGFRFLNAQGCEVAPVGAALAEVRSIDTDDTRRIIRDVEFEVACDVTNPFLGPNGAVAVYSAQKGASAADKHELERGMENMRRVVMNQFGGDVQTIEGGGAAGGVGAMMAVLAHAVLRPGASIVADAVGLDRAMRSARLVITGEGRLDSQTLCGKVPAEVLKRAVAAGVPAVAIGGLVDNHEMFRAAGFKDVVQAMPAGQSPELAMMEPVAMANVTRAVSEFLKHFRSKSS
ncbi:MAG: glycerate kinase [Firmicutes bacterium]|nr:glycerate kinase [Bacillota bacterium]MCM1400564.1 glycerate kinase [Bacteroides sp.]MCM1476468.1 glycerate kinase [Bacteroides sp.]